MTLHKNQNSKTVSILIPTFNRLSILKKCIQALCNQTVPLDAMELVIVDDGSTDGTNDLLREAAVSSSVRIKMIEQTNQGHSAARNSGIKASDNDIILMLDDDIIATPNLVKEHLDWHTRYPSLYDAVLGFITWSPELEINDIMWWCENGGPLTNYNAIAHRTEVDARFFYSGNLSLKTQLLKENQFDETFRFGFDDFELGYRLSKKGLRIHYNKKAIGYHHSSFDFDKILKRMHVIGRSASILHQKWPELKKTVAKPKPLSILRIARSLSLLLYPLAKLFNWRRAIYHYRYQNRLSTEFAKAYNSFNNRIREEVKP